ncbi:hypothetical protein BDP81DRAFT_474793 [Colletotrichum phormii]|uniref:Uncharacterized protein n=1 Tax=Colletotrichum phormii TaxID=359342 RepID=A0AAI9ZHH9_9PEZI|nr:uncharacterized protein BDP81DRAFT_474793 [Colletotrichum phormii]KAK1624665.1 hypothetical protein BDP81DRAFT_474793 [Colletotrichum phormii]
MEASRRDKPHCKRKVRTFKHSWIDQALLEITDQHLRHRDKCQYEWLAEDWGECKNRCQRRREQHQRICGLSSFMAPGLATSACAGTVCQPLPLPLCGAGCDAVVLKYEQWSFRKSSESIAHLSVAICADCIPEPLLHGTGTIRLRRGPTLRGHGRICLSNVFTGSDLGRGTVVNPVTATVDGIFTDTECLKLNSYSIVEQHNIDNVEGRGYPEMNFTVALQFDGCEEPILFVHNWAWQEPELGPYTDLVMEGDQKIQRPCSGLPLQVPAFIYYNGAFTLGGENSALAEYHSAAGVICEPHARLSKVQVTDDGVKPKVMAVSDERQTLSTPNIWTMINMSLPTSDRWTGRLLASLGPVSVDLGFRGYTRADWPTNVTTDMLEGSAQNLTRRLAPYVNHSRVRQKKISTGSGTLLQHVVRLTINPKICLSMIALFVFSAGITAFLLWHYHQDTSIWHRDPATLLGNTMFLGAHPDLTSRAAEINGVASKWHHGAFTPLVLKTISRVVFCIFTILLAGSLIITLRLSETSDGLATIGEDGYLHLMWTSFPATIALGVSLYISSCDWSYCDLATIYHLSRATCTSSDLDHSLLDMLGLRALYYSFRYRLWSITLSQSLALTFSSLWTLQEDTKLTYPENTFDDLVFHAFENIDNLDPSKNLSVAITTPARKVEFQCTRLSEDSYHLSHHKLVPTGQLTRFYGSIGVDFECPEGGTPFTSS